MEIKTIKTDGQRYDKVRNQPRLWLEVEAVGHNVVVEGHRVSELDRIEIYADRLPHVLKSVRTPEHQAAYQSARDAAEREVEAWKKANAKAISQQPNPDSYVKLHCEANPETILHKLGYRGGLPPLASCQVLHPDDLDKSMDAQAFSELPKDERAKWLVDSPLTPDNAQQKAMDRLAATLGESQSELLQALMTALGQQNQSQHKKHQNK